MKNLFPFIAGLALISLFSFKTLYDARKNTAEVEQMEGLFIFVDSKPVQEYEFLGTEKITIGLGSGQYTDIRNKLIKKVKKEYPTADGVLIHFSNGGTDKADAIKFK